MPRFAYCLASVMCTSITVIAQPACANNDRPSVEVIKPQEQSSSIRPAVIQGGQFEVGPYTGFLSVEDFNANPVVGVSATYFINNRFVAQYNYGQSSVAKATFEQVIEGDFLSESDRDFKYHALMAGYNVMPGRSFLGERRKYNSYIYLMTGAASVSFAGEDNLGLVLGITYKTVLRDWLSVNLGFRDLVVERSFLDNPKTTHNMEASLGISLLF